MHSEASSEASSEVISVPKARRTAASWATGGACEGSDSCSVTVRPHAQAAIRGHHLVIGEHAREATVPVPVGSRRRGEHLHARQGQRHSPSTLR